MALLENELITPNVNLLRNQIDFSKVPFSDRGSRLMVFLNSDEESLYIRLAERLTSIESDIEAYLNRPPLIQDLHFIDEQGNKLNFESNTYPYAMYFTTQLGDFGITFFDNQKIAFQRSVFLHHSRP